MSQEPEEIIRSAYQAAEDKNIAAWIAGFTNDGVFTDQSIQVDHLGPVELGKTVETYAAAFPDMHRELSQFYSTGNIVANPRSLFEFVELADDGIGDGDGPAS